MAGAEPLPPLRVRDAGGSPNVIPVFDLIVSGGTLTRQGAGVVQVLIDSGAAGASFVRPLVVDSGGTGQTTLTAFGVLYASGASAVQVLPTMASGQIVVGSGTNFRPHVLAAGAAGQYLVTTAGVIGGLAWIATFSAAGFSRPLVVDSGGTGQTTLTNRGVLIGSAANPVESLAAMSQGQLIVGTNTALAPLLLTLGSQGQSLIIDTVNQAVGVYWSTRRVRLPMALSTVIPTSANAFWMAKSGSLVDTSFVAYVDSGLGVATFWTVIPLNLFPTPNWNLLFYNAPNVSSGGNLVYSLSGRVVAATGSIDGVFTSLVQGGTMGIGSANALTISTASATNFDSTLTLTSGNMLHVALLRHANTAGDTLNDQWNCYSMVLECNVV